MTLSQSQKIQYAISDSLSGFVIGVSTSHSGRNIIEFQMREEDLDYIKALRHELRLKIQTQSSHDSKDKLAEIFQELTFLLAAESHIEALKDRRKGLHKKPSGQHLISSTYLKGFSLRCGNLNYLARLNCSTGEIDLVNDKDLSLQAYNVYEDFFEKFLSKCEANFGILDKTLNDIVLSQVPKIDSIMYYMLCLYLATAFYRYPHKDRLNYGEKMDKKDFSYKILAYLNNLAIELAQRQWIFIRSDYAEQVFTNQIIMNFQTPGSNKEKHFSKTAIFYVPINRQWGLVLYKKELKNFFENFGDKEIFDEIELHDHQFFFVEGSASILSIFNHATLSYAEDSEQKIDPFIYYHPEGAPFSGGQHIVGDKLPWRVNPIFANENELNRFKKMTVKQKLNWPKIFTQRWELEIDKD